MFSILIALPLFCAPSAAPVMPSLALPAMVQAKGKKSDKSKDQDKQDAKDEKPKAPTKDQIKAALEELKTAFGKGTLADQFAAIEGAGDTPCDKVAEALGKVLRDPEEECVSLALKALAKMKTPKALPQLTAFHKKDKRLKKNDRMLAETLQAIAWHGDPKTIDLFAKEVLKNTSAQVQKARILGLGMIRSTESVEALIGLMKSSNHKKVQPLMDKVSMTLTVLVGENDNGKNINRWVAWWNDNKRDLEVDADAKLPKSVAGKWNTYWGIKSKGGKVKRKKGDLPGGGGK